MRLNHIALAATLAAAVLSPLTAQASVDLIAKGSLSGALSDLSGLTGTLESGISASLLGGIGSGLAWAGGSTFLGLPDRGPNAEAYAGGAGIDNTTSFIARFHTVDLALTPSASGSLPYALTPTLQKTTLLYSTTPLNYGSTPGLASAVPTQNTAGKYYFTGRSDNFASGLSTNPNNARLDPEAIRVSNDGKSVFISDEYGPYVYKFDRATGERTDIFTMPSTFAITNQTSSVNTEIPGNTSGRVTNKGMEGLAITPDGKTLVGFMQSPLIQDGGDGGRYNRIVTIDATTHATKQFAYDNRVDGKNYNSSEILALNDHQFLVLERDGKGLGDNGSSAAFKQLRLVDTTGATDVSGVTDLRTLASSTVLSTKLFLDIKNVLMTQGGLSADQIASKLEGIAFGQDVVIGGVTKHTLYLGNDNDFLSSALTSAGITPYGNQWYVFAFSDADLTALKPGSSFVPQAISSVPEPESVALALSGLSILLLLRKRKV